MLALALLLTVLALLATVRLMCALSKMLCILFPNITNAVDEALRNIANAMPASGDARRRSQRKHCFYATVMIDLGHSCVKLTHALFDTGAGVSFISRAVVKSYDLQVIKANPITVEIADGSKHLYSEVCRFDLYIAGVRNRVQAYVEDAPVDRLMLIGVDVMDQYLMTMQTTTARNRGWKVTVAADVTGARAERHVVEEDVWTSRAQMSTLARADGLAWSKLHGRTTRERELQRKQMMAGGISHKR